MCIRDRENSWTVSGTLDESMIACDFAAEAERLDRFLPVSYTHLDVYKRQVWGDVFATELKGNYYKIYSISITDYTGSILSLIHI